MMTTKKYRYVVIVDIEDRSDGEPWNPSEIALWMDARLNHHQSRVVDTTVYSTITDLVADHALDALAENG